jgi:transposase
MPRANFLPRISVYVDGVLPDWTAHRGDVRCGGRPHGESSTEGGRRVFSAEFKRTTVQRILTGEKTVAELSRELDIVPSVIRTWARRSEAGAATAVAANEDVVPASQLREACSRIRDLERLLGRKQMEIEILEAARDVVKKSPWLRKGSGR